MQAEDEDCEKTVPLVLLESSVVSSPPNTTFVCIVTQMFSTGKGSGAWGRWLCPV